MSLILISKPKIKYLEDQFSNETGVRIKIIMTRFLFVTFAIFFLVACIQNPKQSDFKDIDSLQGNWTIQKAYAWGNKIPIKEIVDKNYVLKGNMLISLNNQEDNARIELIQNNQKSWINLIDNDQKIMKGIYRIANSNWEIYLSDVGKERPKKFKVEKNNYVMILKRTINSNQLLNFVPGNKPSTGQAQASLLPAN